MRNLWYFGLEPLKERYTYQLSNVWMPNVFKDLDINFVPIEGTLSTGKEIKVGVVLDAVGRGQYSMSQCSTFLDKISNNEIQDGDTIFLQDYWTSGIDSIFYALDLYGYKDIKVYAMLHAQSVDEYDFTYSMKSWMRNYELGLDSRMTGIFVGSTVHKLQLREAGFKAPIHVVSLPLDYEDVIKTAPKKSYKKKTVIYTSRLDKEKNPYFLLSVAKQFLDKNKDWKFVLTTSGSKFKSSVDGVVLALYQYAAKEPRFILKENLTKEEYYYELKSAKIQFNCALQDYVSWTSLEADAFNCVLVYPNFRSFKEMYHIKHKYNPFEIESALNVLQQAKKDTNKDSSLAKLSDVGRQLEGWIVANDYKGSELNIWHEQEYIKTLV
tara:strand:- start:1227 stop:2369 length:1143 start_codon:yes stop_codon:yes gene_type:complete